MNNLELFIKGTIDVPKKSEKLFIKEFHMLLDKFATESNLEIKSYEFNNITHVINDNSKNSN